ncbi:MAG: glycerol-3-phosphate 1-O-acyltransferase PlsY [Bacteroidota bacterium]|jgi:glycerol-3-phosphate acyltransferase PlsY
MEKVEYVLILFAYLIGSIPTAVWIGKLFYGIDVREHGSGNAGATNTIRVLGYKAGIPVLIIDVLKGFAAVYLYKYLIISGNNTSNLHSEILLCIAALLGHIFPVLAGFKGGKGVATLLGGVVAIAPYAALICVGIFVIVLLIFRYVSLASMISGVSFPVSCTLLNPDLPNALLIFSVCVALLLLITHRKNIQRLIKREESRFELISKR